MSFNGSGTFNVYTPGNPRIAGTTIAVVPINATNTDFASGLSNCVTRDGQSPATANLPMGGFKHTGVADGSASTHYASVGQIQNGGLLYLTGTAGATTITATATPAITAYATGQHFSFKTAAESGASPTININGLGAKNLVDRNNVALPAKYLPNGAMIVIEYDGTSFRVIGGTQDYRMPPVIAYLTADFNTADATWTELGQGASTFTEITDTGGNFDPATGRFTAPVAGIYMVTFRAALQTFAANGTDFFIAQANNSSFTAPYGRGASSSNISAANEDIVSAGSTTISLAAGATVSMWTYHETGATRFILGTSQGITGIEITQVY